MAINPNCNDKAYLLGQLFWHYEKLQKSAMKKVNRSIRDSFFTSAMTRPASVFPSIFAKGQHHISSLERKSDTAGLAVYYNQLIGGIMGLSLCQLPLAGRNPASLLLATITPGRRAIGRNQTMTRMVRETVPLNMV